MSQALKFSSIGALKVIEDYNQLTKAKLIVKDIREFSHDLNIKDIKEWGGINLRKDGKNIIFLNYEYMETVEITFIHEVIHSILFLEGFPRFEVDYQIAKSCLDIRCSKVIEPIKSFLNNVFQHIELYKRLKERYEVDIDDTNYIYMRQKLLRFSKFKDRNGDGFTAQQNILDGLDYYHYGSFARIKIQKVFSELFPHQHEECEILYKRISKIQTKSNTDYYVIGSIINDHLKRAGKLFGLKEDLNVFNAFVLK